MVTSTVRLVAPLGVGGMGSVWLADHDALKTKVVVKFIAKELANDANALSRFAREAAAAAQVKSPHVVHMLDHGITNDGLPYIVMEWLEGRDLGAYIEAHGKMPPNEVSEIVTQVSRALTRAHDAGIVHRDIKPSNIFLCDAGDGQLFVKLLDFGVAKLEGNNLLDSKTRTGSLVGSPHYMSPEQVVGKTIDKRTDLWSLGVVAFEALTGQKPFDAETIGGLALKIHHEPLPLPRQLASELPDTIDAWFEKACAREPADRFQSAKELAETLVIAIRGELPPGISLRTTGPNDVVALGLAKTTVDATTQDPKSSTQSALAVPIEKGRSKGLVVAIAIGALAVGAIGVSWMMKTPAPSGTGATLVPSPLSSSPSPTTSAIPSLVSPSPTPIASETAAPVKSTKPDPKVVPIVHSAKGTPSASAPSVAVPPSASTNETFDIK